uniref:AF4/FMR2 family member lilli n=1 Tax=Haemonchus contortus TaxID=6289 RepID=A0A7I4YAG3_HAECO|nr:Dper\GL26297-PA [Haemonchus contortus]
MAEDPELLKRRHEQQQLRKQLHEVFGPFDQFCEYVAGTTSAGSSGIMRHGVVQIPTTPLTPSARSSMPATSSASTSTTPQQSTQQLLQSMQNLVTSPIQPLQGLPFCNRDYLNTAPSSSTHSAPDTESSAKKGKRHRTMDSDSEVDRDKRRRRNEEARTSETPSTSRSNPPSSSNSDSIRALFGNDVDRKEPPDKGISPDSGVHSAENDPGDENDVHSAQTIINLITKLSPPLSPIKQRPSDKKAERERREMEIREKERIEQQRREKEERERLEKEQAEREERIRNERLEHERREREREEKQRRAREREEKERRDREREEKEREDRERKEKEREEKAKRERENEEKLRKDREEEKLRREKEREKRKERERDRHSAERRPKDSERKDRISERSEKTKTGDGERQKPVENEHKSEEHGSRTDGLRGEIILKGLDRSRLNQLIEIGRRTGRMKDDRKEDRKEERKERNDSNVEKRKDKKEKERKTKDQLGVDDLDALRREKESSAKSSPCIPRASSSQSHDGSDHGQVHRPSSVVGSHPSRSNFECAAPECVPAKPSRPVKPEEGSTEMLYDFYHSVGKSRKRKADAEADKVNKMLFYLDTSVYFLLSAKHFTSADSPEVRGNRQYSIIRDTNDLLKRVTHAFCAVSEGCSPWHMHMLSRIRNLSSRCQANLLYHMYNFRSQNAIKSYTMLINMESQIQEERQNAQNGGSTTTTSSSPAVSVHSNSNQSVTYVTMPSKVYDVQRQQLKTLHHLMWSHRVWQDAAKRADISSIDMAFISGLEKVCGQLFLDAPLEKMCAYMLTAITWLRAEYEREKVRAPPPTVKRTGGVS